MSNQLVDIFLLSLVSMFNRRSSPR